MAGLIRRTWTTREGKTRKGYQVQWTDEAGKRHRELFSGPGAKQEAAQRKLQIETAQKRGLSVDPLNLEEDASTHIPAVLEFLRQVIAAAILRFERKGAWLEYPLAFDQVKTAIDTALEALRPTGSGRLPPWAISIDRQSAKRIGKESAKQIVEAILNAQPVELSTNLIALQGMLDSRRVSGEASELRVVEVETDKPRVRLIAPDKGSSEFYRVRAYFDGAEETRSTGERDKDSAFVCKMAVLYALQREVELRQSQSKNGRPKKALAEILDSVKGLPTNGGPAGSAAATAVA